MYFFADFLGPLLVASVKNLEFYVKKPNVKALKRRFEITNKSTVPAEFVFQVNDNPTLFDVHPKSGKINGLKQLYITVTFKATTRGDFSCDLLCLVWGQVRDI